MTDEKHGQETANLGTLNGILFAEMRKLMELPMDDPDLVARELDRAKAVSELAATTIDNANTVLRAVQVQDGLMAKRPMPKMLGA